MYPRTEEFLTVSEIVEDWPRSGPDRPEADKLLGFLIDAFWNDDLQLLRPGGMGMASRETFLSGLHSLSDTAGIIFVDSEDAVPPTMIHQPDGSIAFDDGHYVVLPRHPAKLPREDLECTYAILAKVPASDYPAAFLTIFRCHMIRREDLGHLCDSRDRRRPSFWFKSQSTPSSKVTSRDVNGCRRWLNKLNASPKKLAKSELFAQAKEQFPTLSRAAFDKLWVELTPVGWRRAGRPRSRPQ